MSGSYAPVGGDRSWWKIPSPLQAWSPWKPLLSIVKTAPAAPGLYRLRRVGEEYPDYVGDTGSSKAGLRKRFDILRHVHDAEMPYRWPYAAMPALWALRDMSDRDLEASFVAVEATGPLLAALKATAIAIQRQDTGESPIANFGRMPLGYVSSSSYGCDLMHSGGLFRGGRAEASGAPAHALPPLTLTPEPSASRWCHLAWTITPDTRPTRPAVYRVTDLEGDLASVSRSLRLRTPDRQLTWGGAQLPPSRYDTDFDACVADLFGAAVLAQRHAPTKK